MKKVRKKRSVRIVRSEIRILIHESSQCESWHYMAEKCSDVGFELRIKKWRCGGWWWHRWQRNDRCDGLYYL